MDKHSRFSLSRLVGLIGKIGIRRAISVSVAVFLLWGLFVVVRETPVDEVVEAIRDLGLIPFFVAMAVLPVIGFPVTPFYLLAGATFGVGVSLIFTALSQAANLFLAYWLARRYLRGPIEKLVEKMNYKIPQVAPKHYVNLTFWVKLTPGPPHFLKSFILGLARVPFGVFFLISWPTTMGFAVGVIIFGDSLADNDLSQAILGGFLMLAFLIALKLIAIAYNKRRGNAASDS